MNKIYRWSPFFIQNFILSIYNVFSNFQKFGYIPLFNTFQKLQKQSLFEDIYSGNLELNLKKNIISLIENIEYYKSNNVYAKFNKFIELPILDKSIVRKNSNKFINKSISNTRPFKTSGSTGSPLEGQLDLKFLRSNYQSYLHVITRSGVDFDKPFGRFVGKDVVQGGPKIYRKDIFLNHFYFSVFHVSKNNIEQYYKAIIKNGIKVLEGYPSVIYSLVKLFIAAGFEPIKLDLIIVTAEKLHLYQVKIIKRYFDCEVFDYYGSNEGSVFIYFDFKSQSYLSSNKNGFLEVLDKLGQKVKPGFEGRMIATIFNKAMPLIRYDIGDRCVLHHDQTNLEFGVVRIKEILGRDDEVLELEGGKHFARFSLLLKLLPYYVNSSQLFINKIDKSVRLNFTSEMKVVNLSDFNIFTNKFNELISKDYSILVQKVEKLEVNNSGKLRTINIY